jgi:hypothetical protein
MAWKTWVIDRENNELIGPCGHRVPNTLEGMKQAKEHECDEEETD